MRSTGTLLEMVTRIQSAGLEVWGGMIVGFDDDSEDVFDSRLRFVRDSRISMAMIGMLTAIPTTPLYKRLAEAGRLDPSDRPAFGTNVLPMQMSREALSRGYVRLMTELYDRDAFFKRFDELWLHGPVEAETGWRRFAEDKPFVRLSKHVACWAQMTALTLSLTLQLRDGSLRRYYLGRLANAFRLKPDGVFLRAYALRCAIHYHFEMFVRRLRATDRPLINTY